MINTELKFKLRDALEKDRNVMFLVGAGISAESGIPTFRGFEGFWTVGSENYTPQEMGTFKMFQKNPYAVWKWYLYRSAICHKAKPNPGHFSLVKFENILKERFALVSQNVDGLHFDAGNEEKQVHLIHGDLRFMRCGNNCSTTLYRIPMELITRNADKEFSKQEKEVLTCPKCGKKTRPHILWFDESYNEHFYKLDTVIKLGKMTNVLFIIGTSGATSLPVALFRMVRKNKGLIINIDPNENAFSKNLKKYKNGFNIRETSGGSLPGFYDYIRKVMEGEGEI